MTVRVSSKFSRSVSTTSSTRCRGNNINFGRHRGPIRSTRNEPIMPAIIVIATIVLPLVLRLSRCASETKGENVDEIDRASSTPRGHLGAADSPACESRC